MPSFEAKMALLVMETHFNYGIALKMPIITDAIEYDNMKFTFTVPINDSIIEGPDIKDAYNSFVDNVITSMQGRNYELSDMYVEEISSNSITFGLDMGPSTKHFAVGPLPAFSIVKSIGDAINVPPSVTSEWTNMPSVTPNHLTWYGTFENIVHKYSMKRISFNASRGKQLVFVQATNEYVGNVFMFTTAQAGDPVVWNNNDLNNTIIPLAIANAQYACNINLGNGYILINFDPRVRPERDRLIQLPTSHKADIYTLCIPSIRCALLREVDINDLHMTAITNPGF